MTVDIYAADEQVDHPVNVERWATLARSVLVAEGVTADTEVSLLFVDPDAVAALNERFLGNEGPTDVLSFPIEDEVDRSGRSPDEGGTGPASIEADSGRRLLLGDVVVCPAVAAVNAVDHGVTFDDEIALLVGEAIRRVIGKRGAGRLLMKPQPGVQQVALLDGFDDRRRCALEFHGRQSSRMASVIVPGALAWSPWSMIT